MALVIPNTLQPGTYEDAAALQADFAAVRSYLNGSLDGNSPTSTVAQQLSLDAASVNRRERATSWPNDPIVFGDPYKSVARLGPIEMVTGGVLHIGFRLAAQRSGAIPYGASTMDVALQLNGTIIRSRFGVAPASGASTGELSYIGAPFPASPGVDDHTLFFSQWTDSAIGILYAATDFPSGPISGAPIPVAVDPGTYVVDLVARVGSGNSNFFMNSPDLYCKAEAF